MSNIHRNRRMSLFTREHMLGFTLVQLLFTIGILTATATYVYSQHSGELISVKNERTIHEIQRIFEASLSYKNKIGTWPNNVGALVTENMLPAGIEIINPWGKQYEFDFPDVTDSTGTVVAGGVSGGNLRITTELNDIASLASNRKNALVEQFRVSLPRVNLVGNVIQSTITSGDKVVDINPGPLLMRIVPNWQIGEKKISGSNICFPSIVRDYTHPSGTMVVYDFFDMCKKFGRKHAVMPLLTSFDAGSLQGGKPNYDPDATTLGLPDEPYFGSKFSELYISKTSDTCANFVIKHLENTGLGATSTFGAIVPGGNWAEVTLIYYCRAESAGTPPTTAPPLLQGDIK